MLKTTVALENFEVFAYHGWYDIERLKGTNYRVSLFTDFLIDESRDLDDIHSTVNYEIMYKIVKEEMAISSRLIEHVAFRILEHMKNKFPGVEKIRIRISKFNLPMENFTGYSTVEMEL